MVLAVGLMLAEIYSPRALLMRPPSRARRRVFAVR